jgi:glycosyltransferase involved in cell wall biosynthesis
MLKIMNNSKISHILSPVFPPTPLDLRVAFISSYPPRRCGIATFTKDLTNGINNLNPERLAEIIALDDKISEAIEYPWEVSHRIRQDSWEDYQRVLDYLNNSIIDIVCIQHEYGIFGGEYGSYIVDFIKHLKKPYFVTLHTIVKQPNELQKKIIQEISYKAMAVVVMLPIAVDILQDVYGIAPQKIIPIHHGAPDFPFVEDGEAKKQLGLEGKIVMSSINLISRWKGLEYAILALPDVVKKYPNFVYFIVGQTHPVILAREGEVYRKNLEQLTKDLKLDQHVKFVNQYISIEELIDYVRASDIYITPYEGLEQISSGSLAYAIAAGKLCISTAYLYAEEMLAGGRGYLIEPKNSQAITDAILHALDHPGDAEIMRQKCYAQGRKMTWARIGFHYIRLMDHLVDGGHKQLSYPRPTLKYLEFLTEQHGLVEHTRGDVKNHQEGYSVDDNARGLVVAVQYGHKSLADKYLNFLVSAQKNGLMYCDMDQSGRWISRKNGPWTTPGVGDWFGRAFWAIVYSMRYGETIKFRQRATDLVRQLIPSLTKAKTIRAHAHIILGLGLLKELEWEEYQSECERAFLRSVNFIISEFKKYDLPGWHWPEDTLRYDNARIPMAILEASVSFTRNDLKELGMKILDFLLDETFDVRQNHFRFIGNKGWYTKGKKKAEYDEQPIEAGSTVQACYAAYRATGHDWYRDMAKKAFAWFHGDNILRRPLYNAERGSVYDGITPHGLNLNQGAENILEYLLAYRCYVKL